MRINFINTNIAFRAYKENYINQSGTPPIPVYLINKEGECNKFQSIAKASDYIFENMPEDKKAEISSSKNFKRSVAKNLKNGFMAYGYIIKKANDIENGNGEVSKSRIDEIIAIQKTRGTKKSLPVYIINRNGQFKKYPSINSVAEAINTSHASAHRAYKYGYDINDYFIASAKDFEDKKGNPDKQKIKDFLKEKEAFPHPAGGRKAIQVYAISPEGECKKFETMTDLANEIQVIRPSVSTAYKRGQRIKGYIIKKPEEIESENGDIDKQKVSEILKNQPKKDRASVPVYCISPDGSFVRYDSMQKMADSVKSTVSCISTAMSHGYSIKGHFVKPASFMEDENGKLDIYKLQAVLSDYRARGIPRLITPGVKKIKVVNPANEPQNDSAVYAIHTKTGAVTKFENIKKAAEVFGIHRDEAKDFLNSSNQIRKNFRLVKASFIEDKDGNVDKAKIKELIKP